MNVGKVQINSGKTSLDLSTKKTECSVDVPTKFCYILNQLHFLQNSNFLYINETLIIGHQSSAI